MATNGPRRRGDTLCTYRATTSLPVPDSPWMQTVVSVAATCLARSRTVRHDAEPPTIRSVAVLSLTLEIERCSVDSGHIEEFLSMTPRGSFNPSSGSSSFIADLVGYSDRETAVCIA